MSVRNKKQTCKCHKPESWDFRHGWIQGYKGNYQSGWSLNSQGSSTGILGRSSACRELMRGMNKIAMLSLLQIGSSLLLSDSVTPSHFWVSN